MLPARALPAPLGSNERRYQSSGQRKLASDHTAWHSGEFTRYELPHAALGSKHLFLYATRSHSTTKSNDLRNERDKLGRNLIIRIEHRLPVVIGILSALLFQALSN